MPQLARLLAAAGRAVVHLVLDDGLVFAGTLGALVAAGVLSRPSLLGPTNVVGWVLFALVATVLLGSLGRARRTFAGRAGTGTTATGGQGPPGPDGGA